MRTVRLFRLGMRVLPVLPEPLIYGACELAALVLLLAHGPMRRAVLSNLRRVAPRRHGLARLSLAQQVIANGLKHHADVLRLPRMSAAELISRCEFSGLSYISQLQRAGKGGIMAVAHTGSFSLVGAALSELGFKLTLFVERIEPPELLELVSALRRRPNFNVVPLGADAGRELFRAVRRGEIVVLASDRDLAGQSMVLPFFGEPAAVPAGPAVLASRGIPLLTAAAARIEGRFSVGRIDPPLEAAGKQPEEVMREIIRRLEDFIGRYPENWSVLQPVWADEASGARPEARTAA